MLIHDRIKKHSFHTSRASVLNEPSIRFTQCRSLIVVALGSFKTVPGEWFHDEKRQRLYVYPNTTSGGSTNGNGNGSDSSDDAEAEAEDEYVGAELMTLLRVRGSSAAPVVGVTVRGLVFRHAAADYLEPHEVPGGGDQVSGLPRHRRT